MKKNKILITGSAGFIGSKVCKALSGKGFEIIGLDSINEYYSTKLKRDRIAFQSNEVIQLYGNLADNDFVQSVFSENTFNVVVNLAAQAGVRYSIDNPGAYMESNVTGFYNILEACRKYPVKHLIYASSSSVYGSNKKVPFEETDNVDNPVSLYAATKKTNELMAHTYSHLYDIPASGLRFFTVYGPMGRPDMAYFSFVDKFFKGEAIKIFNNGDFENDLYRDFTYIDDIVEGIVRLIDAPPEKVEGTAQHEIYNIGNNNPVKLMHFITALEGALSNSLGSKVEFIKEFEPIKPGDVPATYASTDKLQAKVGFKPETSIEDGLQNFTDWYVEYYKIDKSKYQKGGN